MGYVYDCDGFCDRVGIEARPALTCEFNEDWYDSTPYGDELRQHGYESADLVTLCPECTGKLLMEV